jgi:hypothetical protein
VPPPGKGDPAVLGWFREIQFGIRLAERGSNCRKLVEQSPFELPRLDLVLLARKLVDHRYPNLGSADPVAQLRGQIPLDLLAAQTADAVEQRADPELGSRLGKEHASRIHGVARISFVHGHLIDALIGAATGHREPLAHGPEA